NPPPGPSTAPSRANTTAADSKTAKLKARPRGRLKAKLRAKLRAGPKKPRAWCCYSWKPAASTSRTTPEPVSPPAPTWTNSKPGPPAPSPPRPSTICSADPSVLTVRLVLPGAVRSTSPGPWSCVGERKWSLLERLQSDPVTRATGSDWLGTLEVTMRRKAAALAAVTALAATLFTPPAQARPQEPPPYPVAGRGTAFLDHDRLLEGYAEPEWYRANIPFLEVPDQEIQDVYYYRWSTFKRHLRYTDTENGHVITEFHNPPGYSAPLGGIVAAAGHHVYEGR